MRVCSPHFISIIVPIYNSSSYLHGCIDSILSQSYTNFELLLIDDGSTDESGIICDEYVEKDARVRVFHKENGGVSSARNLGLEEAQGEYVCFADSDDTLPQDALKILSSGINTNSKSAVAGYTLINEDSSILYSINSKDSGYLQRDAMLMQFFAPSPYQYQGYLVNKLFHRYIIDKHHIRFEPSIKFNEDRLFCVRYTSALNQEDLVYFNWRSVYNYIQRPNSAMVSLSKRFNPDFITDLEAFVKIGETLHAVHCEKYILDAYSTSMLQSYARFISMMREFKVNDLKLVTKSIKLLIKGIGITRVVSYFINKIGRKFNKIIHPCPNS